MSLSSSSARRAAALLLRPKPTAMIKNARPQPQLSRSFRSISLFNPFLFRDNSFPTNPLLREFELGMPSRHRDPFRDLHSLKMDMIENEKEFVVSFDVPGVDKKDISLSLTDGNCMTISVDHKLETSSSPNELNESSEATENKEAAGNATDSTEVTEVKKKEVAAPRIHWRERSYGHMSRTFSLPQNVVVANIEAKLENGVLKISIPKSEGESSVANTIQIN